MISQRLVSVYKIEQVFKPTFQSSFGAIEQLKEQPEENFLFVPQYMLKQFFKYKKAATEFRTYSVLREVFSVNDIAFIVYLNFNLLEMTKFEFDRIQFLKNFFIFKDETEKEEYLTRVFNIANLPTTAQDVVRFIRPDEEQLISLGASSETNEIFNFIPLDNSSYYLIEIGPNFGSVLSSREKIVEFFSAYLKVLYSLYKFNIANQSQIYRNYLSELTNAASAN